MYILNDELHIKELNNFKTIDEYLITIQKAWVKFIKYLYLYIYKFLFKFIYIYISNEENNYYKQINLITIK